VLLLTSTACTSDFKFIDLWLTADQQGRYFFERGQYAEAAERFEEPFWSGIACYRAEDWDCAIDRFARLDTAEATFNLGNAYAHSRSYELAIEAYGQALEQQPGWQEASQNRALVAALIPKESESPEDGPPGDPTFDADEVRFDEKAERGKKGEVDQALFSDEQIAEMWLRGVQSTPADFLRMKFAFQAAASAAPEREP
jgi:Ca-activated chloride channel family protein